jgi:16S rRNA (guanine966-N2)-methyltransferase
LREDIIGARCLDLFSGSGALGFEALSREASLVAIVDNNRQVVEQVTKNCELLNAQNALVFHCSAESWLKNPANQGILYDIVFLDPPFRLKLIEPICQLLSDYNFVHAGSKIYIEMEAEGQGPTLPFHWQQIRSKQAGQVSYSLYEVKP